MSDELEKIWKEDVVTQSRCYLDISEEGLGKQRKVSLNIEGVIDRHPEQGPKRWCSSVLLGIKL
jgi:hypothetical protein